MRQVLLAGGVPPAQGEESVGENTFASEDAADGITSPGSIPQPLLHRRVQYYIPCMANSLMSAVLTCELDSMWCMQASIQTWLVRNTSVQSQQAWVPLLRQAG